MSSLSPLKSMKVLAFTAVVLLSPLPAAAQSQSAICDGYARNYAEKNSRGKAVGGALTGALGGALIGGLAKGKKGAGTGALIGTGVGALAGGANETRDYNALYVRAYNECMNRR